MNDRPSPNVPMDDAHLARYAQNVARELKQAGAVRPGRLARCVRRDTRDIEAARRRLSARLPEGEAVPPAAEWLLDNGYLALREGKNCAQVFRRGRPLRACAGGRCVLSQAARSALWAEPGLDQGRLELFLEHFQRVCPLTERELSLLVPALGAAVLNRLARLCRDWESLRDGRTDPEELAALFTALRTLSGQDWSALLERQSGVEAILARDPAGDYPDMEEDTRRRYRQQVCRLARRFGLSERETAQKALELAQGARGRRRHVGWYLFRQPLGGEERRESGGAYVLCVLLLTAMLSAAAGLAAGSLCMALLLVFPMSDIVKNCVDFLAVRMVRPRSVHRMALEEGIPARGRTLCVVVSLLTDEESGGKLAALLERYRLANRDAGEELRFGILADLPDRGEPMGGEQRAWVEKARQAVDALNETYGGGFYLFFRTPSFQARDGKYLGWERKRGALLELVRLLKDRRTGVRVLSGDPQALGGTRYVITLDSDTSLNVGAARELVGAMLHPLNQPRIDPKTRAVRSGYALLQPRVSVELEAANRSLFSRIYGGQGGVDPYGATTSDVYHDLFDQGTYTGKGIFQVDAFYACLDGRFPEGRILSHDLLEGSYLHAGLLGEVELTDGFPYQVRSYFARLHRWVRGDWQLLAWLGRTVPDGKGGREKNPLTVLARWKIFDNLRRSLSPAFTLAALMLGLWGAGGVFAAAGAAAVLAAASNLLLSGAELAARRGAGSKTRYHSTIVAGFAGVVVQTLLQLVLLPIQAWTCLSAAAAALWRTYVTRRDLLAWVTAAQSEGRGGGLLRCFREMWFAPAAGLATALLSQLRIGVLLGLVWTAAPAIAWALSRPVGKKPGLSQRDRAFLLHEATLIWRYFADFLRPEDHYLPPDNWQEQPAAGLGRRTSPTNIGMALLSVLAAVDLDLLPRKRGTELIGHMLDAVEKLEKWHGHLYNWYDTSSARPLQPRYVSTVDSGNLCASLIALREGLYEWGEDVLARRAEALSNQMEFRWLYDKRRRLFSIGWDEGQDGLTRGWYDLMASEARQTSFVAVARGEVPPRHWRRLGRMLLGENDYSGMASWTGTMFEYFMPNLLLPCEENSLMYESLAFCIYAQKRRGARTRTPWGISESAFYAFDPGMYYQYKAHGVQSLGLKRGLNRELVIAPYASFLALLLAPRSAAANLRRLRDMGLEGRYGLYEALDCTPSRCRDGAEYEVVRSYMSHHLGMSLVAIDNALKDNVMQRRFLRDCAMSAYRELLQERVPVGAPVMRRGERDVPEKPRRLAGSALMRQGEGARRLTPECHLLSDGRYTVFAADNGLTRSALGDRALTLARPGEMQESAGVSWFFRTGGELFGLTAAPLYRRAGEYGWEFYDGGAAWTFRRDRLEARTQVTLPSTGGGELRQACLSWKGEGTLEGELLCYLEPVLFPMADYEAHPAFARLFLESARVPGGVSFRRRPRGREEYPALCVLWSGENSSFTTSREQALGRGGLRALAGGRFGPLEGTAGGVLDPCLLVRWPVRLRSGESARFRLALGASDRPGAALDGAHRLLEGRLEPGDGLTALSRRLELSGEGTGEAFALLRRLAAAGPVPEGRPPQRELWPFGISGDVPIAAGLVAGEEDLEKAGQWAAEHLFLNRSGFPFDLVLLLEEGGDYRRPLRGALTERIKALGGESFLGGRGGIHLLSGREGEAAVLAWAGARLPLEPVAEAAERWEPLPPVELERGEVPWRFREDGSVVIETGARLPAAGWSQVLCNESFGWVTDETGNGLLWQGNSREGRLTRWYNDPLRVGGGERIALKCRGRTASVFADGDGLPCDVIYGPGFARWEKSFGGARLTVQGWVPPEEACRKLLFTLDRGVGTLSWRLGEGEEKTFPLAAEGEAVLEVRPRGKGVEAVFRPAAPEDRREREGTERWWRERVSRLTVRTPRPELDRYLGGWGLYQVLACRLMARTSQYQNGGAYGFRDQLQDVCALLPADPSRARRQLLLAASRQFAEGDVQHWWHPPHGAGIRSRISDDLLWLPYVLERYVSVTGDWAACREQVPFLSSPPLRPEEQERYETPQTARETDTLFRHACLAVDCVLSRGQGEHGLARMGGGDWNDGMNRVGEAGRGESVWLTWFLVLVLERMAPLCRRLGEEPRAEDWLSRAKELRRAAEAAWDGGWYRRGCFDSGAPLGSAESRECRIDSIAQSFSAFCGAERANQAVSAALEQLYDREHKLARLLWPPFDGKGPDPGYIRGYLPGVRENGGQYTHGAVWLAMACFALGRAEEGARLLLDLLPENHPGAVYRVEPYVLAADVYAAPGHMGRGGWSWYTGAAGWYCRAAAEMLLGLKIREGKLYLEPCLPADWPGYEAEWKLPRGGVLRIRVTRAGRSRLSLDGAETDGGVELAALEGDHALELELE